MFTRKQVLFASPLVIVAAAALAPALAAPTLPAVNVAPQNIGECGTAIDYRGSAGVFSCACPSGFPTGGSLWGTEIYTDDSNVCKAALHAGVIGRSGGQVAFQMRPGQSSYQGTVRNGVSSSNYGSWSGSFRFVSALGGGGAVSDDIAISTSSPATDAGACDSAANWRGRVSTLTCTCPANFAMARSVWGSDVYTDDSYICKAGQHAGVLARGRGGRVTVELLPGRPSYSGTTRNGVSTSDYGSWGGSYRFVR